MDFFSIEHLKTWAEAYAVPFVIQLLTALAIFVIGRAVARFLKKLLSKVLRNRSVDIDLSKFLVDMAYAFLLAVVVIAALERLGVKTTAAIAILGAAGLAVGFALQGSLGNFAAGVMILIFRPYKAGDLVKLGDFVGHVKDIKIFVTVLRSPDNKEIILPNGQAIGGAVENFSTTGHLRVDLVIGVGYGEDLRKAKEVLTRATKNVPGVLTEPAPTVAVSELGDSSVNFVVRPHAKVDDYWSVYFGTLEACKIALDDAGIEIPFPQRDVHVKGQPSGAASKLGAA